MKPGTHRPSPWSALKRGALSVPHPILLRAFHLWWDTEQWFRYEYHRQKVALPELQTLDLASTKRSDTVFILGSGASINLISEARWAAINRHDSFGFNFFHLHPHRPTLYAYEYMGPSSDTFRRWEMHAAREDYREIPKLFVHVHPQSLGEFWARVPATMKHHAYTLFPHYTFARNAAEFRSSVEYLRRRGLWDKSTKINEIFKYRGTLTMMISVALRMGYRNIVLCGVDLNNWDYFFDDASSYPGMADFLVDRRGPVHGTQIEKENVVSMTDIVAVMTEFIAKPLGAKIFVEHSGSALYPHIPLAPEWVYTHPSAQRPF